MTLRIDIAKAPTPERFAVTDAHHQLCRYCAWLSLTVRYLSIPLTPTGLACLLRRCSCIPLACRLSDTFWGVLLTYAKSRKGAMCCSIEGTVVSISHPAKMDHESTTSSK